MSQIIFANGHGKWSNQSVKDCFRKHEKEEAHYTLFIAIKSFNLKLIDY